MPFDDSRRLTGSNLFFDSAGAVLEAVDITVDEGLLADWRSRVLRARSWLQWPDRAAKTRGKSREQEAAPLPRAIERAESIAIRRHAGATALALAAPFDQLFTATEVNEWALCSALVAADPARWRDLQGALVAAARTAVADSSESAAPAARTPIPVAFAVALPVLEERAAFARFATLSKLEAAPSLRALVAAADARGLLHVLDENHLTLGSGAGGRTWPVDALPDVPHVPWADLYNVPSVIVTGSNGKTTTVRLLAACIRAHGWRDGYNVAFSDGSVRFLPKGIDEKLLRALITIAGGEPAAPVD